MKVVCISTKVYDSSVCGDPAVGYKLWKYLTLNKEYECIGIVCRDGKPEEYQIVSDNGEEGLYPICNFTARWLVRDNKLKELGI